MTPLRIVGLLLLAVGIVLLVLGINASQSLGEEVRQELAGDYSDKTIAYIVGGIAGIVVGGGLLVAGFRRKPKT